MRDGLEHDRPDCWITEYLGDVGDEVDAVALESRVAHQRLRVLGVHRVGLGQQHGDHQGLVVQALDDVVERLGEVAREVGRRSPVPRAHLVERERSRST